MIKRFLIMMALTLSLILECARVSTPIKKDEAKQQRDPVKMVLIHGGTYTIGTGNGDADEMPAHEVYLDTFFIDIHEVTNSQYAKFINETGHKKPDFWYPEIDHPDDPVVGVSWYDAVAYASWAGKRLPTEAEWEVAARGGNMKDRYPWGDKPDMNYANFKSFGILPVMSLKPNGYGLYDMIGNVWEWCGDWYNRGYYSMSSTKNPQGPLNGTYKVLRGGAWYCDEDQIRVTNRFYSMPDARSYHFGFRCVKSAK